MNYDFYQENETMDDLDDGDEYRELSLKQIKKQQDEHAKFLRQGTWYVAVLKPESYYFDLYAWAVKHVISSDGWKVISTRENKLPEQYYSDVSVALDKSESVLLDGRIFLEKQSVRYLVILNRYDVIEVAARTENADLVKDVIQEVETYVNKHNFYRGKKLEFDGKLSFIKVEYQGWDDIVLDPVIKEQIRQNTIGFIANIDQWKKYGIPAKRGIILCGDPGTGKTIVCKALLSEAEGVTIIVTDPVCMASPGSIINLFSIARDLSPAIVIIEDIDMIGIDRDILLMSTPPLLALLAVMDGITENQNIITVGTTNSIDKLDKTLRERPARFDRIFILERPDYGNRVLILRNQAKTIPLREEIIEYIGQKTNQYTPAQLKEIMYSMVISRVSDSEGVDNLGMEDVDRVISQMEVRRKNKIGF